MKRIFTIGILFLALLLSSPLKSIADPTGKKGVNHKRSTKKAVKQFSGAKYMVATQEKNPLIYTRKYSKVGKSIFKTTYQVYDVQKKPICLITALHNKAKKSIEVSVKDLQVEGFPLVNLERTSYEVPYTGRFGAIGKIGAIGKGRSRTDAPSQLTLSFVNKRFDYIKVVNVADAHEDTDKNLQVFILEQ